MRPYIQRILKGSKLERGPVVEQIKRTPRTSIWHAHFYNIRFQFFTCVGIEENVQYVSVKLAESSVEIC